MGAEGGKQDLWLNRINVWIAILGGVVALVVGAYNLRHILFSDSGPGDIAALVRTESGSPVARVRVELLTSQNALVGTSETGRDGRYVRKDLEAGSYIVKVAKSGFEPQVATVNVASKKTTDVELVLRPQSSDQASGSPIRSAIEEVGASWLKNLGKPKTGAGTEK